ncbi:hypothetical protein [Halosegnis longus]|uniref:hypothetical protein n=1 Tax=Halosegnis longus TaxID=2216012 RepID=UPI00129D9CC2|nr:hypothetical protein [Halosegnis longus]
MTDTPDSTDTDDTNSASRPTSDPRYDGLDPDDQPESSTLDEETSVTALPSAPDEPHVDPEELPLEQCSSDPAVLTDVLDPHPDNTGPIVPVVVVRGVDLPLPETEQFRDTVAPYQRRTHDDGTETVAYVGTSYEQTDTDHVVINYMLPDGIESVVITESKMLEANLETEVQCIANASLRAMNGVVR